MGKRAKLLSFYAAGKSVGGRMNASMTRYLAESLGPLLWCLCLAALPGAYIRPIHK